MFGPIIRKIVWTRSLEKSKFILMEPPVSQPMELHVHSFFVFWLHFAVDDAFGSRIICLDWCWRLGVPHFFQNLLFFDCFSCIDVQAVEFSFHCGRHDSPNDFIYIKNSTIVRGKFGVFGQIMMSPCSAACIFFIEVTSVTVYHHHHVTFMVSENGRLLCGEVIKELFDASHC